MENKNSSFLAEHVNNGANILLKFNFKKSNFSLGGW